MGYEFAIAFAVALIFWAFIWWVAGRITGKYMAWKHEQYSRNHFRQTERYRRDFL